MVRRLIRAIGQALGRRSRMCATASYEAVVHANSSFRANRINKECGPINDPQLHANCVASFGQ
jgi:hypothetical protein